MARAGEHLRWRAHAVPRPARLLIGLGVILGTVVGLSFLPLCRLYCPTAARGSENAPTVDWTFVERGAFVIDRWWAPKGTIGWWRVGVSGDPVAVRWNVRSDRVDINVPVWPAPAVMLAAGCGAWIRTWRSERGTRPLAGRRVRAMGGAGVLVGLVSGTLVGLSFLCRGGVQTCHVGKGPGGRDRFHVFAIGRGGVVALATDDVLVVVNPPRVGPTSLWWCSKSSSWSLATPCWPLPIILLAAAGRAWQLGQRRVWWGVQGRCAGCGYSLAGLTRGVCPECGTKGVCEAG